MSDPTDPIVGCLEKWHRHLRGELPGGLDELLHEDVVFLSPIVFTPQKGREVTKLYLMTAGGTLAPSKGADGDGASSADGTNAKAGAGGGFRYVREIIGGHDAMLEFETSVDGKYVNGVDIICCDDEGRIVDFKVMLRPLQAINLVHEKMRAALEASGGA